MGFSSLRLRPCLQVKVCDVQNRAKYYFWFLHAEGDNFFKSASYTIEALCASPFVKEKGDLREVESQLLTKRGELSKFESEYREVIASSC